MLTKPMITFLVLLVPTITANSQTQIKTNAMWEQCGCLSKDAPWTMSHCNLGATFTCPNPYYHWRCPLAACTSQVPITCAMPLQQQRIIPARMLKNGGFDYGHVLNISFLFYEAQRAGKLPHTNRIPWRADSFLRDKTPNGKNFTSGGWMDAGDNMRFNFPMAWSAGILAWSVELFKPAYRVSGTLQTALVNLKWVSDYFIECYYADDAIIAQLGNGHTDHSAWTRPEYIKTPSHVHVLSPSKPGSDLCASVAGFLAIMSRIMRETDPKYASKCLFYAHKYYQFATKYTGKYSVSLPDPALFYPSGHMYDDLAWGAINIYLATNKNYYLTQAKRFMQIHWRNEGPVWKNYDWDSHAWGVQVLLAKHAPELKRGKQEVEDFVSTWLMSNMDGYAGPKYTPKGLAWYTPWGSLRHSANAAFLMLAHAKENIKDVNQQKRIACFAHKQLRYMLGSAGRSYVVGYGKNPPMQPHHRASSCPLIPALCDWSVFDRQAPNPSVLFGALVGGPDINDFYKDKRQDYISNEVATDYNAGFTGALAGMAMSQWPHTVC